MLRLDRAADDQLLIDESATLYDAMEHLERCRAGFTLFAVDQRRAVVGSLTRGDVIRCLSREHPSSSSDLERLLVADAMTRRPLADGERGMLYIRAQGPGTWFHQLTTTIEENRDRWQRIKLLPVLSDDMQLVNVLDLEAPRARRRLEILVMATAFPLERDSSGVFTAHGLEARRASFDSVHYGSHWQKVEGLCALLLQTTGGSLAMLDDVFNAARADEIVHALSRAEEWLDGHVSGADLGESHQAKLRESLSEARRHLLRKYTNQAATRYFPTDASQDVYERPEVIVVLGCRGEEPLRRRLSAAVAVAHEMRADAEDPTIILSGGGSGHTRSEAQRMLDMLVGRGVDVPSLGAVTEITNRPGWWTVEIRGRPVRVVLEEDSLDTLGNAVFTWFTLKLDGKHGLTTRSANRLERLVLVTDEMHAPRSYDIFRRVFAFRPKLSRPGGAPQIVVRTIEPMGAALDENAAAQRNLRSESVTNAKTFRLVNPLTNDFDIIEDGHVRSILGQMLRLHDSYKGRWDLVRKYRRCWVHEPTLSDAPESAEGASGR